MTLVPGTPPHWFIDEQRMSETFGKGVDRFIKAFERNLAKEERNATIEECARLIEADGYDHDEIIRLAAAIRALKEKS